LLCSALPITLRMSTHRPRRFRRESPGTRSGA
jgi:hypothetical protein